MEGISRQMKDKKVSEKSHIVGDSLLWWNNLLGRWGESCGEHCFDFSKAFDSITQNILVDKLESSGLDRWTRRQMENCLNFCDQKWCLMVRSQTGNHSWVEFLRSQYWVQHYPKFLQTIWINKFKRTLAKTADDIKLGKSHHIDIPQLAGRLGQQELQGI